MPSEEKTGQDAKRTAISYAMDWGSMLLSITLAASILCSVAQLKVPLLTLD
jgi:hypothetical protein